MSPQLTLQTPLELPPSEVPNYLNQLWSRDQANSIGAHTFCLLIWQPAWVEQQLVRTGRIEGPIMGVQRDEVEEAGRKAVLELDLPLSTPPLGSSVSNSLAKVDGSKTSEDLRGQHVDEALSTLRPRRLITLAPSLDSSRPLETLVAAYCPLPEEGGGHCCLRRCGGAPRRNRGLAGRTQHTAAPTPRRPALLGVVERAPR